MVNNNAASRPGSLYRCQGKRGFFREYKTQPYFGILRTLDSLHLIQRFLSLTELRTPHGALNIVAALLPTNEFEEVGKEGGIQKPL